jgi:hypothetical protein
MVGQVAGMDYTMVVQMVVVSNPSNGQEDRSKTNHGINAGERTGLCCRLHTVPRREERGQSCQLSLRFFSRLGHINRLIGMIFGLLVTILFTWPLSKECQFFKSIIPPKK